MGSDDDDAGWVAAYPYEPARRVVQSWLRRTSQDPPIPPFTGPPGFPVPESEDAYV